MFLTLFTTTYGRLIYVIQQLSENYLVRENRCVVNSQVFRYISPH
jgi:hypothetical protein